MWTFDNEWEIVQCVGHLKYPIVGRCGSNDFICTNEGSVFRGPIPFPPESRIK